MLWADSASLSEPLKPPTLIPSLRPTSSALLCKNPTATGTTHAERRSASPTPYPNPLKLDDHAAAKWMLWRGPQLKRSPQGQGELRPRAAPTSPYAALDSPTPHLPSRNDRAASSGGSSDGVARKSQQVSSAPAVLYNSLGVAIPSSFDKPAYRVLIP